MKSFLMDLPLSVNQAYEKILERNAKSTEREKTKILLQIVIAARRPLTTGEFQAAYELTQADYTTYEELKDEFVDDITFEEILNDHCGLLLAVHDSKVYFIHQTAREFLTAQSSVRATGEPQWQGSIDTHEADSVITTCCIRMLFLKEFDSNDSTALLCSNFTDEEVPSTTSQDTKVITKSYQLLHYAPVNWTLHYRTIEHSIESSLLRNAGTLCDISTNRRKVWTMLWYRQQGAPGVFGHAPMLLSDIDLAGFMGLYSVALKLLNDGANMYDLVQVRPAAALPQDFVIGKAALTIWYPSSLKEKRHFFKSRDIAHMMSTLGSLAFQPEPNDGGIGIESFMTSLITRGFEPNTCIFRHFSRHRYTLLNLACKAGWEVLARKLACKDVRLNFPSSQPLEDAMGNFGPETIRILLKHGAVITARAFEAMLNRNDKELSETILSEATDVEFILLGQWHDSESGTKAVIEQRNPDPQMWSLSNKRVGDYGAIDPVFLETALRTSKVAIIIPPDPEPYIASVVEELCSGDKQKIEDFLLDVSHGPIILADLRKLGQNLCKLPDFPDDVSLKHVDIWFSRTLGMYVDRQLRDWTEKLTLISNRYV